MSAKKQALFGILGGLAAWVLVYLLYAQQTRAVSTHGKEILIMLPLFPIYGFGYAFAMPLLKRWLAKVAGASGDIMFWSLISQLLWRRGIFFGFFLCFILFAGALGLAYLPGIYIGIKRLIQESRANAA